MRSSCSTSSPDLVLSVFLILVIYKGIKYLIMVLIFTSLVTNDVGSGAKSPQLRITALENCLILKDGFSGAFQLYASPVNDV